MSYSFNKKKEKVIDVEVSEKDSAPLKPSFKDRLGTATQRIQQGAQKYQEFKKKQEERNLEKLQADVKKTKLQAELAKNQDKIKKFQKHKPKSNIWGF